MPAPSSVAEFVEVVRKSGLVPDDKLRTELDRLRNAPPAGVEQISQAFVRDALLTRFQSRQLKLGRYKRFTIAGKYRLLELLGVGGMGAVYLCEHMFMKRLVALKVLPQEKLSDPSNVERFYREARAVAALNDPNIVRAYDIDKAEGLHFLVMEYVDGVSLQELVAKHGPLDPVRVATYAAQTANGLQHASELSMVHRDIKPGNLLLDRTGVIKILDMGLARFFADKTDNLTAKYDEKSVLGTADYLAPEQALSNVVDTRADIYALGGTMYFLLTGKSPVPEGGSIAQKLVFHQNQEPKPIESFRPDVPAEMLALIRMMMAKDPADRPQTPAEVAEALAPWADTHLPPPPDHEMPDLCPAVLALSGHSVERSGVSTGRSSVSGRFVQPRSGAGSGRGTPPAPASDPSGTGSKVRLTHADLDTDRASAVRTEPIPTPPRLDESDAGVDLRHPDVPGAASAPKSTAKHVSVPVWSVAAAAAAMTALAALGAYLAFGR